MEDGNQVLVDLGDTFFGNILKLGLNLVLLDS